MFFLLTGCMGRRYLPAGKNLLVEQKLDGAEKLDKDEIESLYAYKPNRKILFIPWSPYVDLYQGGLKRYDSLKYEQKKVKIQTKFTKKIAKTDKEKKKENLRDKMNKKVNKQHRNIKEGNFGMRMGEPLAIYDTAKENETVRKIQNYMETKGYFNAKVSHTSEETYKMVSSIYTIERNQPYVIDSIFFNIPDTAIYNRIQENLAESTLQKGENYEQENLVKERDRLNDLMLNNGYYNFNRQFITFVVDSSYLSDKKVIIGLTVRNPNNLSAHKIYTIDSVIFTTDADISGLASNRQNEAFEGVTYQFYSKRYSEKILDRRIFLKPGELYKKSNTLETQKQLSNMDIFKFINVNYDTTGGQFISNVFTSPLKKFQTSSELGLNVSKGLPGPFFNASIKNRNTFKGLEVMELSGRVGFEGLSGATDTGNPYSSLDYGANLTFTFPQFMLPIGSEFKSKLGRLNPKTRLSFGLNYTNRPEYIRTNVNTSLILSWQNYKKRRSYSLNIADISFIDSNVTDEYQAFLDDLEENGNNLTNSFLPSFVSSTWFSVTHNINEYGNRQEKSAYLRYQIESGGNLYSAIAKQASDRNLEYFKYAKVDIDYRHSSPINSRITMAYRAHLGVAVPYGANKTLPYEEFFFAGGSNSIRAWEPRRLGPGSYLPIDSTGVYSNNFEQPGEILLETSIELRHKIFGFLFGALFIDMGNVWTMQDEAVRPGGQFQFDSFLKEIAIGGGYGVRLDFSFLLLRLDAAWKLYDPGSQNRHGNNLSRGGFELPDYDNYKRLVWNLGIGYPF
ncbi:BamA/TamA family outer membrane protein [Reichenbachiella carrageenanivorans]|uniref:BamA/TamA family outer membrane protein n=1 Tax=Reichenbachiella carrageenanivorans TaxID=2979869 RepID=A0ABY6CUL7_9BACT|nr:BamA/TamA family outer membrane protein [Reichenbachiella carrageenanivorans]UXX77622.1 BamA/TamA family outer membrane protein [Reichenbachiella carrageenanivorans]